MIKMTSTLNFKDFIKDTLRYQGSYIHYPFLFGFHPEFSCKKLKEFGEFLKKSNKEFQYIKYVENSGGCVLKLEDSPWKNTTL